VAIDEQGRFIVAASINFDYWNIVCSSN